MGIFNETIKSLINIDSTIWSFYLAALLKALVIIVIAGASVSVLNRFITKFFKLYPRFNADEKKSATLAGILKSVVKYIIYIIAAITILNAIGIPTAPILATAGIGGLAVGFGAQSLVKDVFAGFFILFEDQYRVGDFVSIVGMTGTIEDIGLRTTKIREFSGVLHIIPNGEIKTVTNYSKGDSLAVVDIGIAYEEDANRVIAVLEELAEEYYQNNMESIVQKPEVLGIIKFNESEAVIRTIVRTKPQMHWKTERELRKKILEGIQNQGIKIPYPRRVITHTEKNK